MSRADELPSLIGLSLRDVEPVGAIAPRLRGVSLELYYRAYVKAPMFTDLLNLEFATVARWLQLKLDPDALSEPLFPKTRSQQKTFASVMVVTKVIEAARDIKGEDRGMSNADAVRRAVALVNGEARREIQRIKSKNQVEKTRETKQRNKEQAEREKEEANKTAPSSMPHPNSIEEL